MRFLSHFLGFGVNGTLIPATQVLKTVPSRETLVTKVPVYPIHS